MAEENTEDKQTFGNSIGEFVGDLFNSAKEFGEQVQEGFDSKTAEEETEDTATAVMNGKYATAGALSGGPNWNTSQSNVPSGPNPSNEALYTLGNDAITEEEKQQFGNLTPPAPGAVPPQGPGANMPNRPSVPGMKPDMPAPGFQIQTPDNTIPTHAIKTPQIINAQQMSNPSDKLAHASTDMSRGAQAEEAFNETFDTMELRGELEEDTGKQKE